MFERSHRDIQIVLEIVTSIEKIETFMSPFTQADEWFADTRSFDAALMNFIVIGECVLRLLEGFKEAHGNIPWSKVKRFRNLIAHDYFGIDAEEVWQIAKHHLPALKQNLQQILALQ
jgi:uncharacterized protein with HEPN domain